jgi:hypothetical protein
MIGGSLESDEHQVCGTDFLWNARDMRLNMKIAFIALDPDAVLAHRLKIRSQKKVDFVTGAAQLCAVKTSQRSWSNDCDLHNCY